jgi:NNP family nitrate/nitrite transporter-like MFS transporter
MTPTVNPAAKGANAALGLTTFAFTACFAVWTIFAILGLQIQKDLGLTETQFGLLVGTPILTGSLSRLVLGIWADQYGGRIVNLIVMLLAALATWLLTFAETYPQFLLAALGIGIAGGSFSVSITYVSKFFPPERQGSALGIVGAGNVGAAVTKFAAPLVMAAMGWKGVANVWALALVAVAIVFFFFTKDDPDLAARRLSGARPRSFASQFEPLRNVQVWRFSLYYFFVFGAFVALAALAAALSDRRLRLRHRDGRHAGGGLFGSCIVVPHLWRPPVGSGWGTDGDVLDLSGVRRCHVLPLLSADLVCGRRCPRPDQLSA